MSGQARKRLGLLLAIAVAGLTSLWIGMGIVRADTAPTSTQNVINQTIYKAGNTVIITGTINGDVYCAGQTVTIDATVNGDILCAGQTITINGLVNGDVRVAGQTITLNGEVTNGVSLFGQTISLQKNSSVGRDATLAGQDILLDGTIGRDVTMAGTTITLNGTIGGNATYTSPKVWAKSSDAVIAGKTTYHVSKQNNPSIAAWAGWAILWWLFCVVALAVLSLVLVGLFPQLFRRMQNTATDHLGYVFLTGFMTLFILPSVVFMSFLSVVGFAIGILLLLLWGALAIISLPVALFVVGNRLAPHIHPLLIVLIGALLLGVIGLIPFVGWVICWIMYVLGSGTIVWHLAEIYQKPNYSTKA
jgi:hypothetical protein